MSLAPAGFLVAFVLVGCAHPGTGATSYGRSRHVGDLEQKLLVVGPARVTHVKAAGDGTLFLYSATASHGTDDDCIASDSEMQPDITMVAASGQDVNIAVPQGKVECASVAMGMGMDVTWVTGQNTATASR